MFGYAIGVFVVTIGTLVAVIAEKSRYLFCVNLPTLCVAVLAWFGEPGIYSWLNKTRFYQQNVDEMFNSCSIWCRVSTYLKYMFISFHAPYPQLSLSPNAISQCFLHNKELCRIQISIDLRNWAFYTLHT